MADSLKDYFNPEKGAGISWEYLFDTVSRIIRCIDGTIKNLYNEKVLLIGKLHLNVPNSYHKCEYRLWSGRLLVEGNVDCFSKGRGYLPNGCVR